MFGKAAHKGPQTVTLPDGRQVTLDRDFSAYTIEELAALGITPGLGEPTSVQVIARAGRQGRDTARLVMVPTLLMPAAMFGFTVVLASGKGGTWARPAFLVEIGVLAIASFALLARGRRPQRPRN